MKFKSKIPSLFTIMNLCCGFAAILVADLHISSILILFGMFFDVLDGLIARMLKVQSDIGKELDSFADIVSFGVAPAYLYTLIIPIDHWVYYIPAFFILIGSALRLAIFNLMPDTKYFTGLPTPASSFFLVGLFIGVEFDSVVMQTISENPIIYTLIPFFLMLLNLSKIKMFSFKQMGKMNYNVFILVCIITFGLLTMINYRLSMPLGVIIYIILSMIYTKKIHKKEEVN